MTASPLTRIWLAVTGLTLANFAVASVGWSGRWAMLTVLALAFVKGRLVIDYFMDLRYCRPLWRGIVMGWLGAVTAIIAFAYWLGSVR